MKILSLKLHGVMDYVTVIAFAIIPSVFDLAGVPAYLSYALAGIHLLMTLLTRFPLGVLKIIPVKLHKLVEVVVGPVLIVVPWVLGFSDDLKARYIFIVAGIAIILVGQLTQYSENHNESH